MEETPYTSLKVMLMRTSDRQRAGQTDIPRRVQRMRETSKEDALASPRHFFAPGNGQNWVVSLGLPITSELSTPVMTSTVPTTSTTTTTTGAEMGSPRSCLLNASPSRPTVTATCRP